MDKMFRLDFKVYVLCFALLHVFRRTAAQNYVNIATGKTYTQSSEYFNQGPSSNAANGDTGTYYDANNCIHTEDGSAQDWWEVDLGQNYPVYSIKVWARAGFKHRLYAFTVTVDGYTCAALSNGNSEQAVTCSQVITGRRVRLTRTTYDDQALNLCELQIYVCNAGWYGTTCNQRCLSNRCSQCDQQSGLCSICSGNFDAPYCTACNSGWYGANCDQPCLSDKCYQNICEQQTGRCTSGCNGNFNGPLCIECVAGFHGQNCDQQCSTIGAGCTECTRNSAACTACASGYHGQTCSQQCSTIGAGCSQCTMNSVCTACTPGYHGQTCDQRCSTIGAGCLECNKDSQCTACTPGYYGQNCNMLCSNIAEGCAQCDRYNALCTSCKYGFAFPSCTECTDGRHGTNCELSCTPSGVCQRCVRNSGQCLACNPSYNLKAPSCTDCLDDYYRQYSYSTVCTACTWQCYNNAPCDQNTGNCDRCPPGRRGNMCQNNCLSKTYGQDCNGTCGNCKYSNSLGWTCNAVSGSCQHCQPGYQLPLCKLDCRSGSYGEDCRESCGWCEDGGTCDRVTGQCPLCEPGWQPPLCKTPCTDGWYGVNCTMRCGTCKNSAVCDKETGYCPCPTGKQPPLCDTDCLNNMYGQDCAEPCGHCKDGMTCDPVTGQCASGCAPGYIDTNCQQACQAGYYGDRCNETCGNCVGRSACLHETGICRGGCADGFAGDLCAQAVTQDPPVSTGAIAGAVVAVIVAIVIAVVVIIFVMRSRRRKGDRYRDVPTNATNGSAEIGHEVVYQNDPNGSSPLSFTPVVVDSSKPKAKVKPLVKPPRSKSPGPAKKNEAIYENVTPITLVNTTRELASENQTLSSEPKHINGKVSLDFTPKDAPKSAPKKPVKHGKEASKPAPPAKPNKPAEKSTKHDHDPETWTDDEAENVYANEASAIMEPTTIPLDSLQKVVVNKIRGGRLADEFSRLDPQEDYPVTNGQKEENYYKNRFNSILPYDQNRVELQKVDNDDASDYINASFVKGYKTEKAYIAAQGARDNTVDDFWRMVWQEGVTDIVMLTNVKEGNKAKCHEYWPGKGSNLKTKHMQVTGLEEETRAFFYIRTFQVCETEGQEKRVVKQYHYVNWMDHEVPATTPLINFWRYVTARAPRVNNAPPLVVHCSAGVGRTGTYIALDVLMDQAQDQSEVDIFHTVQKLREDRCHMVQNKSQYEFLHEAFLEAYSSHNTRIPSGQLDTVFTQSIKHDKADERVDAEFERLKRIRGCLISPSHETANMDVNKAKNRSQDVLPDDKHLLYLTEHVRGRNQYINAVFAPTFQNARGCIMTQLPLPDTLIDMWRLIDGNDVSTVVAIGDVEGQKDMCYYWPTKAGEPLKTGSYVVSLDSLAKLGENLFSYSLVVNKEDKSKSLKVLHLRGWSGQVADSTADLIHLLTLLHSAHGPNPVVLQCLDGATRSGVVCALWDVISRMTSDDDVDVYLAVRQVHIIRQEAVNNVELYRYCYEVVQQYQNSQSVYANT